MRKDVKVRFENALERLVDSLQKDAQVVAVILEGSLAYDTVWEKSDIDLMIIVDEQTLPRQSVCLLQDGIPIHTELITRNSLKRRIGGNLGGSREMSFLVNSKLLFTKDPTVEDLYRNIARVGVRDRELLTLTYGSYFLELLIKSQKWNSVKNDPVYAWVFFLQAVQNLSRIVVLLNGQVPLREAVYQAREIEGPLFDAVYGSPMNQPKSVKMMENVIDAADGYVTERSAQIFKALLDCLSENGGLVTLSEIEDYFSRRHRGGLPLEVVCPWLADRGMIVPAEADIRLTPKSRISLSQPAYTAAGNGEIVL